MKRQFPIMLVLILAVVCTLQAADHFTADAIALAPKQGNGFQRIVKADRSSGVQFELQMDRNHFHVTGRLAMQRQGRATRVTWTDWGQVGRNPLHRWLAFGMDWMMGKTIERSLAALKKNAEGH